MKNKKGKPIDVKEKQGGKKHTHTHTYLTCMTLRRAGLNDALIAGENFSTFTTIETRIMIRHGTNDSGKLCGMSGISDDSFILLIFLPVLEIGFEHFEQICSKTAG
jgi:hypothetical protein